MDESNANKIVLCIRAFQEHAESCGMEGVFRVVPPDGAIVDMFQNPGLLSMDVVNEWCNSLLKTDIVNIQTNGTVARLPVCPCNELNLCWSARALLSSCAGMFKPELKLAINVHERWGPRLLFEVFCQGYPPCS